MSRYVGARELGLRTSWRFRFVGVGERADTTPGVVYLDVGGCLKPGVLDHHQHEAAGGCAADLVFRNRELVYNHLLSDWLRRHDEGTIKPDTSWSPTLITHSEPDWDSLVSVLLVMELIENGDFPAFAESLVGFTLEVDQGRYQFTPTSGKAIYAPHLAYLAMQNLRRNGRRLSNEECLEFGLRLIRRVLQDITQANASRSIRAPSDFAPTNPGATLWTSDPAFAEIKELLDAEPERFERDRSEATTIGSALLPAADGSGTVEVKAFVSPRPTKSILNKYWVRANGYPLFVCPVDDQYATIAEITRETVFRRAIVSVDPHFKNRDGRRVDLRGLGFALEREESAARRSANDGIDPRGGAPRFGEGYCDNSDPWYDGRAHAWTIVDSPHTGTFVPYSRLCAIVLESHFWEIPLEEARVDLIWVEPAGMPTSGPRRSVDPPPDMTSTLGSYFREMTTELLDLSKYSLSIPPAYSVTGEVRRFPFETSPAMRILHVESRPGATLEGLVELRNHLSREFAGAAAAYSIARVRLGAHFSSKKQVERLMATLADSDAALMPSLDWDGNIVLLNGTNLILHQSSVGDAFSSPDSVFEILVYAAFVNEALVSYSKWINRLVPARGAPTPVFGTGSLRRAVVRFQSCYYELEVSRSARGRLIFGKLMESLHLPEQYQEVLSELERLRELEDEYFEARRSRSERAFEFVLFIVAVFGSFQTLIAFYTLNASIWRLSSFKTWIWTLCTASVLVYLGIAWYRREKRVAGSETGTMDRR